MDQTPNLKMPYILPSQVQKLVTHNEAWRQLDAVEHLSVKSRNRAEAPEHLSVEIAISWLRLLSAGRPMSRTKRT